MAATKLSTTYSVKATGKVTSAGKTFNKTMSGLDSEYLADPDQAGVLVNKIFAVLDTGVAETYVINKADKYEAVAN